MVPKNSLRLKTLPLVALLAALTACGGPYHRQGQYSSTAGQRSSAAPVDATYVVQAGDTVYGIARNHGLDVNQLAASNGLAQPWTIQPGQVLTLPGTAPVAAPSEAVAAAPVESVAATPLPAVTSQPLAAPQAVSQGAPQGAPQVAGAEPETTVTIQSGPGQPVGAPQPLGPQPTPSIAAEPISATPGEVQVVQEVAVEEAVVEQPAPAPAPTIAPTPATHPVASLPEPPARAGSKFIWPVDGTLLSGYGPKADGMRNDGINIGAPEGAPVKAADNGVVAYAGEELRGFGNLILIKHQGDYVTAYAHNEQLLVKRGDVVRRGETIARVGSSGNVDSPQLHFEVRHGSQAIDPITVMTQQSAAAE